MSSISPNLSKEQKAANLKHAVEKLKEWEIEFVSNNDNIHIQFHIEEIRFDFWPTTHKLNLTDLDTSDKIKLNTSLIECLTAIELVLFSEKFAFSKLYKMIKNATYGRSNKG